jgi:hypothetical protein
MSNEICGTEGCVRSGKGLAFQFLVAKPKTQNSINVMTVFSEAVPSSMKLPRHHSFQGERYRIEMRINERLAAKGFMRANQ